MEFARFEWDSNKELQNLAKHGVSFHEAQFAFADERRVVIEDLAHSGTEPRHYCIGRVERGIVTVRFTRRGEIVRIIGAGFWRKGKAIYETENALHR